MKFHTNYDCRNCENPVDITVFYEAGTNSNYYSAENSVKADVSCEPSSCPFCGAEINTESIETAI
jgi:hypothetical protein